MQDLDYLNIIIKSLAKNIATQTYFSQNSLLSFGQSNYINYTALYLMTKLKYNLKLEIGRPVDSRCE